MSSIPITRSMTGPVTVIINNCNLLTWPRAMVRAIETFERLAEILIVDNGSTYEPLLEYYKTQPHPVVYLGNVGHKAPWIEEVKARVRTELYVVTDPDLDLKDTPKDCLIHLASCLQRFPQAGKIGLGLSFDDVPRQSPYFHHVNAVEGAFWRLPLVDGLVRPAPVDTTFAIYHKSLLDEYRICGMRTDLPYAARHFPWYIVEPDAEFRYYLAHANASSSYKSFVGTGAAETTGLSAEQHKKQGNQFLAAGDLGRAEKRYRQSIASDPAFADAFVALGFVLQEQRRWDEARYYLEQAVRLDPGEADSHYLLGTTAREQGRPDAAIGHFNRALELKPGFAEARYGLGMVLRTQRRVEEALRCLDEALSLNPDFPEARFNKSLMLLLLGNLAEGLELFESRIGLGATPQLSGWLKHLSAHPEKPRWQGGDLKGKRLLVWTEKSLGDCLMTMRYLPKLAEKGVRGLIVLSDPSLTRLFQALPLVDAVTSRADSLPLDSFDLHCSIMSLPYLFGTRTDTIPNAVPYLPVPGEMRETWSRRIAMLKGRKVGLVWSGNKGYERDSMRSLSLRQLEPFFAIPGVNFISLQKGAAAGELGESQWPILDRMSECGDLLDTAALAANLDLVISVDTSVAHLAGALGRPVWLLNHFESEWRWRLGREDSPWYPSMRIFNQPSPRDWDSVLRRVAAELARLGQ